MSCRGRPPGGGRTASATRPRKRRCATPCWPSSSPHSRQALSWLRYGILALFLVALVAHFKPVSNLLAPYSAYGRIVSNLFAPLYLWGNNLLAYLAERAGSYAFYTVDVWVKGAATLAEAAVTFIVLAVLAWRNGRTYCNTVCPVGTILGLVSRFAVFKPRIDTSKCNGCGLCARNCKASCIDAKTHRIDYSRCVACMDCLGKCRQGAISFSRKPAADRKPDAGHKPDAVEPATLKAAVAAGGTARGSAPPPDGRAASSFRWSGSWPVRRSGRRRRRSTAAWP